MRGKESRSIGCLIETKQNCQTDCSTSQISDRPTHVARRRLGADMPGGVPSKVTLCMVKWTRTQLHGYPGKAFPYSIKAKMAYRVSLGIRRSEEQVYLEPKFN